MFTRNFESFVKNSFQKENLVLRIDFLFLILDQIDTVKIFEDLAFCFKQNYYWRYIEDMFTRNFESFVKNSFQKENLVLRIDFLFLILDQIDTVKIFEGLAFCFKQNYYWRYVYKELRIIR